MRRLATAAIICAALSGGTAQAQTVEDALANSRWGWLGFESDLSKIPESEIQAASQKACTKPKLAFRVDGQTLTMLDYVVSPPSPLSYPKARVLKKEDRTLVMAFYSADGDKPDAVFALSRGGSILSVPDKMFGTWHYARCPQPGAPVTYDAPAPSGGGRRR